jgi:hypothetical protein
VSILRSWRRAPGSGAAPRWRAPRSRGQAVARKWLQKGIGALDATLVAAALFAWAAVIARPHPSRTLVLTAAALCAAATAAQPALLAARVRSITRLRRHGQLADAQVTSVRRIRFGSDYLGGPVAAVTVSFTDASGHHITGQYNARLTETAGERPGQDIQVVYDPRHPARFRRATEEEHAVVILTCGLAVIAAGVAVTAWLFFRAFS